MTRFELVEYRSCDCGGEGCPGENEFVLLVSDRIDLCREFMLKFPFGIKAHSEIAVDYPKQNEFRIKVNLLNGKIVTRKFRINDNAIKDSENILKKELI